MITLTIEQALEQSDPFNEEGQTYIYTCHDTEIFFYIGISIHPYERLEQHMGEGVYTSHPSPLGDLIILNRPISLQWLFDVYTVKDIVTDIRPEQISPVNCKWTAQWVEEDLIRKHQPCLNSMGNRAAPKVIPAKYKYRRIANEGVIITTEEG